MTCGLKPKKTNYMYPECETTFEKDACCGSIAFDSGKFICCDGKLSKKYDHTCCGKKLINPSKYGCCNDRKYDLRLDFPSSYAIKNDSSFHYDVITCHLRQWKIYNSKKICVNESKIKSRKSSTTEDFSSVWNKFQVHFYRFAFFCNSQKKIPSVGP